MLSKKWMSDLLTNILGNILTPFVLTIAALILGGIYLLFTNNLQLAFLVVLTILTLINLVVGFYVLSQQRSMLKAINELAALKQFFPSSQKKSDPLSDQAEDEFEITNKHFDPQSTPQKIIVKFTNIGENTIFVKKIMCSDTRELPALSLAPDYKKDGQSRDLVIPLDDKVKNVLPGKDLVIELRLRQRWNAEDINKIAGRWGYFHIDAIFKDQPVKLFYSF